MELGISLLLFILARETGYYRVNYDATNWNLIVTQLLSDYQQISLINRAQLLDDSLNVARINALPYAVPLSLAQYLTAEREYIPWTSGLNGLSYLDLMYIRTAGYGDLKVRCTIFPELTFSFQ